MDGKIKTAADAMEADALGRCHEVHTNPEQKPMAAEPAAKPVDPKSQKPKSPAQWAYERIIMYLKNFEEQLDADHEVAMGFTGGDAGVLRIEGMGFFDPDVVTFYGTDPAGGKTQLIQHVTQLNVMLRALPKAVQSAEPNRIGFRLAADLEDPDT